MRTRIRYSWLMTILFVLVVVAGLTGCTSPAMKGTPFYEGVSQHPPDAMQRRVNLWPAAYYYDPYLSVLWPVFEKTDTQWAVRPLFGVSKLDKPQHSYNVLWPLGEFDYEDDDYRFFPFFWGNGRGASATPYFAAFPIVWYEKADYFVLFPLYWYFSPDSHTLFPIFWYKPETRFVIFPLYMRFPEKRQTDILWPLINVQRGEKNPGWRAGPFVGKYRYGDGNAKTYSFLLWPLGHRWRKGEEGTDLFFPLIYRDFNKQSDTILSPLYMSSVDRATGETARFIAPTYLQFTNPRSDLRCLFPLYFGLKSGDERLWVTPLLGHDTRPDSSTWILSPLLSSYTSAPDHKEVWAVAPLSRFRWGPGPNASHLLPLYYYDGREDIFLSLLYAGFSPKPGERTWIIPPLLTGQSRGPDFSELWAVAPLYRYRKGPEGVESHAFPFYFSSQKDKLFLSLPYARFERRQGGTTRVIPPLLTGWTKTGDAKDLWSPWPLVWNRWGPKGHDSAVVPLYGYFAAKKTFVSIPYSRWNSGEDRLRAFVGPLYVHQSSPTEKRGYFLWPLTSLGKSPHGWDGWFTLFIHDRDADGYNTWLPFPIVRAYREPNGHGSWFFPLWSYNKRTYRPAPAPETAGAQPQVEATRPNTWTNFRLLLWLYTYKAESQYEKAHARVLWHFVDYKREGAVRSLDVFPAVSYDRDKETGYRNFSFLWRFYRNRRDPDGSRKMDILFVPVLRTKGSTEPKSG